MTWVEPRLAAEVTYAEKTREGRLRAPVYLGIRDDVPVERPPMPSEVKRGRRTLKLSNLDKPFWPEEGITKGELLAYYRDVADVLVPHLRHRPFTMKRYPDGWQGKSFFQKQAPSHIPDWIETAPFPASTREGEKRVIDYALVDDELALLWMVNMGCIDMHAWASRADRPDRPDWVMFDLDPAEGATFENVIEVALLVREVLDVLGLESVPKTSGSRGIHVLVPITRRHGFDRGARVRGDHRRRARARPSRARHDRVDAGEATGVLVDANQNGPGQDDGVRLLRAAARGRVGLGAAALGRGAARPRPERVHDGRRARRVERGGRPVRAGARGRPVARCRAQGSSLGAPRGPSSWGRPSADSSTMSRRKKSATVQSVTTRALRRIVGSA